MADPLTPPGPGSGSNASSSPDEGAGPDSAPDSVPAPGEEAGPDSGSPGSEPSEQSLGDIVATARDIVLYAPIALVLDAPTLLPKLAEQGKVHMRNARALGPHALRRIQNRLIATTGTVGEHAAELLRQVGVTPEPPPPAGSAGSDGSADDGAAGTAAPSARQAGSAPPARPDGRAPGADGSETGRGPSPAVDELAIPDYDSLSALQVVDRLPGLTAAELEAVRAYEAAHRGRKTILNKAAQLQA